MTGHPKITPKLNELAFSYDFIIKIYMKINFNYFHFPVHAPFLEAFGTSSTEDDKLFDDWANENSNTQQLLSGHGYGIYPIGSLMNHHCKPTVRLQSSFNSTIKWVANQDIRKGEELTIAYVDPQSPFEERQQFLKSIHHFSCPCETECIEKL